VCGWVEPAGDGEGDASISGQRFISGGTDSNTHLEAETPEFGALWRANCE